MKIQNAHLLRKLEKAGLSDKEARVYLAVLELGGAYPSKISQHAGLNRTTTYHILERLAIQGMINEIEKKNKIFYQIERPEKLINYTESQKRRVEDQIENAKQIIPDIEGLYAAFVDQPKVKYYEGTEGMVEIYKDMIDKAEKKYEMLAFSNAAQLEHVFPKKFFENFRRTKEKKGITTRGIIPDTPLDRKYNEKFFKGYKPEVVPRFKYVPPEMLSVKAEITIYGENKVSIVNLNKEHLTGIVIEDQTIHEMMKMSFELSWNSSLVRD